VNDFALYQVAKGLNREADSQKYLNRSRNWRQHWNPEATALGFKGFVVPRTVEGFLEQNPLSCGDCYWSSHCQFFFFFFFLHFSFTVITSLGHNRFRR